MPQEPFFGNWMVAITEAAVVAGASELDTATPEQLAHAWEIVAQTADITVEELTAKVAAEAGLTVAHLGNPDPVAVGIVPAEVAHRRQVVPVRYSNRELTVATSNPLSVDVKRELADIVGRDVVLKVAEPSAVAEAVLTAYGEAEGGEGGRVPAPEQHRPGGPHVLVVDDEAGQRALFRSVLEKAGYRVTVASDGPEAIAVMEERDDVDLVTLDYWMDKMNGLRVLTFLREMPGKSDVPIVMVTGAGDRRIEMSLFEAGADDFISKPIDAPLFLLRIQAVLRRRQLR